MKERPILFSGEMVRAILDGRKTQTRRVVKKPRTATPYWESEIAPDDCPYGVPGDLLWVRETWVQVPSTGKVCYKADGLFLDGAPWRPSIYMPRWASRITLRVTDVRVERVQDIREADAQAEGVTPLPSPVSSPESAWRGLRYVPAFAALWNDINAARGFGWKVNPWVWVVEFERITP